MKDVFPNSDSAGATTPAIAEKEPEANRRRLLQFAGLTAGAAFLEACSGGASVGPTASIASAAANPTSTEPSSTPATPTTPAPVSTPSATTPTSVLSPQMAGLKAYLAGRAIPGAALPTASTTPPSITWAGPLTNYAAATTLPSGNQIAASSPLLGGPMHAKWSAGLPGNPTIGGYPCLAAFRSYTCKGVPKSTRSPTVLRFKTDAPVIELTGVVADGSYTTQTLMVNGQLCPPVTLSSSRGAGGWNVATIRIAFGNRATRDIWIETALAIAYIKIDQHDTLFPVDDGLEPQMTVIGDSYQLVSSNAFGNGGAIALELGARLGVRNVAIDGVGGTGYWNSGNSVGSLADRLPAHGADGSLIYVIVAGLNDYGDLVSGSVVWPTRTAYEQAVSSYLQGLRTANPNSLLVVTSPLCPNPTMSDSNYVAHPATNSSGVGDFLYKAQVHKAAIASVTGPWVYVDALMGGGWLNSSGASGDVSGLQWFTGGTPAAGTTATNKPGNTGGGTGGGYGGINYVLIISGGQYTQAPEIRASGGSGTGLTLAARISATGAIVGIAVVQSGTGYTAGTGLPTITIDATYQLSAASLGTPVLIAGVNPLGQYPLLSFAPAGVTASQLNNAYSYIGPDLVHPSPLGASYLSLRLARSIYQAVMAL